ncbi:hypothetical protein FPT15_04965 [Pseudomonas sp. RGB]|nr:hypothetical protein FPT15_04965 [Pseudomonas sp. RGB]
MNTSVNLCPRSVGAGLPAMQATGCSWQTQAMLSQASQLPHKTAPHFQSALIQLLMVCDYAASQ